MDDVRGRGVVRVPGGTACWPERQHVLPGARGAARTAVRACDRAALPEAAVPRRRGYAVPALLTICGAGIESSLEDLRADILHSFRASATWLPQFGLTGRRTKRS